MSDKRHKASGRLYALGDVHGCADELESILKAIAPTAGDTVVFVGDYVDRGPASSAVVELALALEKTRAETVFLKGNHEDMMLSFLGLPGRYGESFLFNGGISTMESYGLKEEDLGMAIHHIPPRHIDFFKRLSV